MRVYIPGCWDLFHAGHLHALMAARAYGEDVFVGVASDEVIIKDKGKPPVIPLNQRVMVVQNIKWVDVAVPYYEFEFLTHIKRYEPDVVCWGNFQPTEDRYIEAENYMMVNQIQSYILPRSNYNSTSNIKTWIKRFT